MAEGILTIRQVAGRTGVSSKTLRFWETKGLLPKPSRNHRGYRLYQAEVVDRVRFIEQAKSLGFTLAEITRIFELSKFKRNVCAHVSALVAQKIGALDQQIRQLSELRDRLTKYQGEWEKRLPCPPRSVSEVCCLIEGLHVSLKKGGQRHALLTASHARKSGRDSD